MKDETPTYLSCRIVDGAETGSLLLAELDAPLVEGHQGLSDRIGVFRLRVGEDTPVTLNGETATVSDLQDGMLLEVAFNGDVMETYPAQLGEVYSLSAWFIGGGCFDLCGLYLQVLDDLWNRDEGLNSDISVAGLDLSQAPGELSESEKAAIARRFGELHDVEVVTGTFEELKEAGYITAADTDDGGAYHWADGCLFSITANEDHDGEIYSLPTLFFNAQKWRSPLGAYYLVGCSARWPESGTWSGYTVGAEAIS
jgi:hypothetical protein